jgi:hypothetical protein
VSALGFLSAEARAELEALVNELVERKLAEREAHRSGAISSPWLYGAKTAAEYLGWPTKRVYNRLHQIPHRRDGSRLLFNRGELDAWVSDHRVQARPRRPSPSDKKGGGRQET